MQKKSNILKMTESAIMIAFATVLSEIKLAHLPFGGSVTAFAMLPLIIIAYRYGTRWGLLSATVAGIFQLLLGMSNLRYGTSLLAVITIILFDYIVAYGLLGLGGIFKGKLHNQGAEMALGSVVALTLRYICHVITGATVWGQWAPEGQSVIAYSLEYNATYMLPEIIITAIGAFIICAFLDFDSADITRRSKKTTTFERTVTASMLKITGILTACVGILSNIYGLINAFLEESNASSNTVTSLLNSVVIGLLIYGFGELIQICYNIYKKLDKKDE
ncbi:MAG: energy-coupled thiamine transporter ThiT [Acutalibacteraceae bacterium]